MPKLTKREFSKILNLLRSKYGEWLPRHVDARDPFKTLVGAMLSHRTRDEVTDKAYTSLFSRFRTPEDVLNAKQSEIARLIKPVGFYRQKAKRIKDVARILLERYGGKVPDSRDELVKLPGVGDKTADIVLSLSMGLPEIAVDTHVEKISKRLGIVSPKASYGEIKRALEEITDVQDRRDVNRLLVQFGKDICTSPKPKCSLCPITDHCDYFSRISAKSVRSKLKPY